MPTYRPAHVGVSQSQALADAYLHAPSDDPVLVTLELHHSTQATPVRIVNDWSPLTATLEADAPQNAGAAVVFAGIPFAFTRPPETDGGMPAAITIRIDNLNVAITSFVLGVQESQEPILILARTYLPSDLSAPHELPVMRLYAQSPITIDGSHTVSLQCTFGDLTNRKFPRMEYRRESHPALSA